MTDLALQEARQSLGDPYSCVELITTRKHMALSPSYLGKLRSGVNEQLTSDLRVYSDSLNGALIAYDNIKLVQRYGVLLDDQPYIHFDIQLEMLVFRPTVGSILRAVVHEIAADHVGCLVHGCFNAAIPKSNVNGCTSADLVMGQEFLLKVVRLDSEKGILSIKGVVENMLLQSGKKHKKKRKSTDRGDHNTSQDETHAVTDRDNKNTSQVETDVSLIRDSTEESSKKKKKRKKDKKEKDNPGEETPNKHDGTRSHKHSDTDETTPRKKKKHHKEKHHTPSQTPTEQVRTNGNELESSLKKSRKHKLSMDTCDDNDSIEERTPKKKKAKRKSKEPTNIDSQISEQSPSVLLNNELDNNVERKKHKKSKKNKK